MFAKMRFSDIVGIVLLLFLQFRSGNSQSMDPRVNITETLPISAGSRVRGIVSQDVLLSCKVENLPNDLKVHWQRTTFDISSGTIHERVVQISIDLDIVDNTKWSIEKPTPYTWRLRIRSLALTDEGNYTCYVPLSDKMNRAESNRTVFAFAKPVILEDKSSSDMSAKEADTVTLICNATGRPVPTVLWRREGYAVLPGGGTVLMGSELILKNVDYTARGTYVCDSMNEVGEDIRYIQLSIIHGPKMSSEEESVGQAVGYTRTLLCYVDANPVPSTNPNENQLYWSRGGVVIVTDTRRTVIASIGAYGRLVFELVIHSVIREDYGTYTCTARNGVSTGALAIQLFETSQPQDDKGKIQSGTSAAPAIVSSLLAVYVCFMLTTAIDIL